VRASFYNHLHPPTIPAQQARFRYTLGAGGISVFLTLVVVFTGILEMFYYIPDPENAAQSIQTLSYLIPYGWMVRNLHYWSAQFLVIAVIVHLIRVIFTGAYRRPRQFNYLIGLLLLVLVFFLDFTGYVLRWDQGIHWALVTGTNLIRTIPVAGDALYAFVVGSRQPDSATLIRFYAWHVLGLTILFSFFTVWHIFRVRRDGGISVAPPQQRSNHTRITRFELTRRESLAMIFTSILLLGFSIYLPAPIAPGLTEANILTETAKAPWFFLWIQQLLRYGNPFLFGILIPIVALILLVLLPYLLPLALPGELGKWFPKHNRLARVIFIVIFLAITVLTLLATLNNAP
jgi:quinol-cytochrome oxidoreductase complex cytochrome b subunit